MAEFNISGAIRASKPMVFELEIKNPPPQLTLLINPESLDFKFTPRVTESRVRWTNTRDSGYIFQTHHDELDILSVSGQSAMFYIDTGLTSAERKRSIAWENIQKLVAIYRNNGMNFNSQMGKGMSVIESVGRVHIVYDEVLYIGSFDSFTLNEAAEKPFNLNFTFDFRVTKFFDSKQY
jgi:hypothetical protein